MFRTLLRRLMKRLFSKRPAKMISNVGRQPLKPAKRRPF